MKKRILALTLGMLMVVGMLAACGGGDTPAADTPAGDTPAADTPAADTPAVAEDDGGEEEWVVVEDAGEYVYPTGPRGEGVTINIWAWNDEVYNQAVYYKEQNPEFLYDLRLTQIPDTDQQYIQALNVALMTGGSEVPDMYVVESASAINYTRFDFADFAMPYDEVFGLPAGSTETMAAAAEINTTIKSAGTNFDGEVVALGFQSTGSAFIYRRSLAEQIWGTDDPDTIQGIIGPGYDKFLAAAAEAKEAGVYMVAGEEDLWQAIRQSPNPWIVDGKLVIDDQRLSFLDIGYEFYNNDYSLKSPAWQPAWNDGMAGVEPVLGYLGPAWLINYIMVGNAGDTFGDWAICMPPEPFVWGGSFSIVNKNGNPDALPGIAELIYWLTLDTTDDGFQYGWANQTLPTAGAKDSVASGVVMARSDGSLDYLGGQNAFDVFVPAGASGTADGWGPYDETLNARFMDHARLYFDGTYADKDEMIAAFQQNILDLLGIAS